MIWRFGDHELDDGLYQLRRRGRVVPMEPRVFDVLRHLIEHRDRVVSKDELLDTLWPGEATSDSVLPRCIAAARRAVRDDRTRQRVIQTVHGRGYRFAADAERHPTPPAADTPPAPPVAEPQPQGRFVGRTAALALLRESLAAARGGTGRVALLVGEPGIGKTRTAEELGAEAESAGVRWLTGRCYEGRGAPALWPWLQVLRGLLGDGGLEAALPELSEAEARDAPGFDGEQLRFRLFDAIARLLAREARSRPLLVALDDLHWADSTSLALLQFAAAALRDAPVLLLASYRDVEVRRDHPLRSLLGALAREPHCRRVALRGLAHDEVAALVEAVAGRAAQPEVVDAVVAMTEGNPFFVREVAELLASDGRLDGAGPPVLDLTLPQGVRDAIGRRLDTLTDECVALLRAASVIGRSFDSRLLAHVVGTGGTRSEPAMGEETLFELLAEAEAAGILAESDEGPGRYTFTHALIRQVLYEELRAPQRTKLHRAAGEALATRFAERPDAPAAELAHHFFEAVPAGRAEEAMKWCVRAAERAHALLAYRESADHYERALEALEFSETPDPTLRCSLLVAWGNALRTAGQRDRGRAQLATAADLARSCARADLLARAAIGYRGFGEMGAPADPATLALLEEALRAIGDDHPLLRSQLLSRLTGTPPHSLSMARRQDLSREAWDLARSHDDPAVLTDALSARYWATLGPDALDERLAVAREAAEIAARTGDRRVALIGHEIEIGAYLMLGDEAGIDAALGAYVRESEALRQPIFQFLANTIRASRAMNLGRFSEAEELIRTAFASGRGTVPFANLLFAAQVYWLLHQRGEGERVAQALVALGQQFRGSFWGVGPLIEVMTAFARASAGDLEGARACFEALAQRGFETIERDEHWLLAMHLLADLACALGDARRGDQLADLLAPYAERIVSHDLLRTLAGSVHAVLGQLALLGGRADEAVAHYQRALVREDALGVRPAFHASQAGLARALAARGEPGDAPRARDLAEAAETGMRQLGGRLRPVRAAAARG